MAKIARIKQDTGIVENIMMPYGPPQGYIEVDIPDDSPVCAGYTYASGVFTEPKKDPEPDIQDQTQHG